MQQLPKSRGRAGRARNEAEPLLQAIVRGACGRWPAVAAAVVTTLAISAVVHADADERFPGWQTMRVILQEDGPRRMRAADLTGDGRDELLVVNTRQSRIDIYAWVEPGDREQEEPAGNGDRVNELPTALEFERTDIPLEQLPNDVLVTDVDDDGQAELLLLVASPNRVLIYEQAEAEEDDAPGWEERRRIDLLQGGFAGGDRLMLLRELPANGRELLIGFEQGIQRLSLEAGTRPSWLEPRDEGGRSDWWLIDLNADGQQDLVEWRRESGRSIRWYQAAGERLLPPQVLHDRSISGGAALAAGGDEEAAELLLLGGVQQGLLRRHSLQRGEQTVLGRRDALPLPGEDRAVWAGVELDGDPSLVAADPEQPRLLVYALREDGWEPAENYPIVADVEAVAAPAAEPGTLLMRSEDAADLHISRWDGGRFSYPKPWRHDAAEADERRILALRRVGSTVWWAQRVGDDIDLYVWPAAAGEPQRTRFAGVGGEANQAVWLGADRLLVLDQYAREPRLVRMVDGEANSSTPSHLQGGSLDEYRLFEADGEGYRAARLSNGVLQWLDDDLHADDQIMLPEGERLASYVPLEDDEAWALQQQGEYVHRLRPDEAGVPRVVESIIIPGGSALTGDPVLGLLLHTRQGVVRLAEGEPWELHLEQGIDGRTGRPNAGRDATIHRVFATDITGDGREEIIVTDDARHQLTVLARKSEAFEPLISWPVYEDRAYPYGGGGSRQTESEPRSLVGLDIDGDGRQDLAMLCHDRLLIYLARE